MPETTLIDVLGRVSKDDPPLLRTRGRTVANTALMGTALSLLGTGVYAALGAPADIGVTAALSLAIPGLLLVWRRTLDPELTALWVGLTLSAIMSVGLVATRSPVQLGWLGVVMACVFLIGGTGVATRFAVLGGALVVVGFGFLALTQGPPLDPTLELVRGGLLAPAIGLLAYLYESVRQKTATELSRSLAAEAEANRAKSAFLAKVSHELRTPLNGVVGLSEALLTSGGRPTDRADLEMLHASGVSLLSLVNELLEITRAQAGEFKLLSTPLNLKQVLDSTLALYRQSAAAKGLTLQRECTAPERLWLLGDAGRLKQVLGNLVSNALKFTQAGSVTLRASAARSPKGWKVRIEVVDTGPGIPPGQQHRLFQPFSQLSPSDTHQGTGLGLAISKELIERMGGTVQFEPSASSGATFVVQLALPETEAPAANAIISDTPQFEGTVLVVDDNALNRRVAEALLARLGFAVEAVGSGAEGVERVTRGSFAAVLLDLQMPQMDGYEAAKRMLELRPAQLVLALTASAAPEVAEACLRVGMRGCLSKPLLLGELARALEQHLSPAMRASA